MSPDDEELVEKITREDTPAGVVVYREFFDRAGNLIKRDVEHLVSIILTSQGTADLTPKE